MRRGVIFVVGALVAGAVLVSSCAGWGTGFPMAGGRGPGQVGPAGQEASGSPYQPLPGQSPYNAYPGGGMMGGMMGQMWGWSNATPPNSKPITIQEAAKAVERYLEEYGAGLALREVMEFEWNYYAEVVEEATGVHAMELLVDKYTGQVLPEMGPNMMWNTKYGMMQRMMGGYYRGGAPTAQMSIGPQRAKALAQEFLNAQVPGATVAEADAFYGYYTLHTLREGRIEGMLSVNGYSGQVWYHSWHGVFVQMEEFEG